jgi:hypothetical protein
LSLEPRAAAPIFAASTIDQEEPLRCAIKARMEGIYEDIDAVPLLRAALAE